MKPEDEIQGNRKWRKIIRYKEWLKNGKIGEKGNRDDCHHLMTPFHHPHTAWKTPFPEVNSDFLIAKSSYLKSLSIVSQLLKLSRFLDFLFSSCFFDLLLLVSFALSYFPFTSSAVEMLLSYILSSSHPLTSPRYQIPVTISATMY